VNRSYIISNILLFSIVLIGFANVSDAAFRSLQPVAAPRETWSSDRQTAGALPGQDIEGLAREARTRSPQLAREAMQRLVSSWNQGDTARFLSPSFVDRDRFITSWDGQVPRDARIRLLSVESAQALDQDNRIEGSPPTALHVSTRVSVRATTQIEFNDPALGFQRREGRNEYFFVIRQRISLNVVK